MSFEPVKNKSANKVLTTDANNEITVKGAPQLVAEHAALYGVDISTIGNTPTWIRYTVTYTDLSAPTEVADIELFVLPAACIIHAVKVKHSEEFTGGALVSYRLSLGVAGNTNRFTPLFNVFTAPSGTNKQLVHVFDEVDHDNPTSIRLEADASTGETLDEATQGIAEIWVLISRAPSAP